MLHRWLCGYFQAPAHKAEPDPEGPKDGGVARQHSSRATDKRFRRKSKTTLKKNLKSYLVNVAELTEACDPWTRNVCESVMK